MRTKVGVMGSAGGPLEPEALQMCYRLGQHLARRDCVLLTGACPGLPHEAALGAKSEGGLVIGVSPALSLDEHIVRYHSPYQEYDAIVYTGSGLMGREITTIRSCDIVVIVGGRSGTLGEFAIAYDEGKLIGVLEGTGGVADHVREVVRIVNKTTRAEIIYDRDPVSLLDRCLEAYQRRVEAGIAHLPPQTEG